MNPQLKTIVEKLCEKARQMVEEHPSLHPAAFLIDKDYRFHVVQTIFGDECYRQVGKQKDAFAETVRRLSREHDIVAVLFIAESWTLSQDDAKEFQENIDKYQGIASHPRRREAVVAQLETKETNYLAVAEISPERKVGEFDFNEVESMGGRFAKFLRD